MADVETTNGANIEVELAKENKRANTDAVDAAEPASKKNKVDESLEPTAEVAVEAEVDESETAVKKLEEKAEPKVESAETKTKSPEAKAESAEATSKLEKDIIRQVEYYFGDANLFRDHFLQAETAKNDGWVTLETLLTFKRLSSLSKDPKVIADALDKSDEGLIEVHEDRQSIRRHPERPLPEKNEETRKEVISRTAYVKGFPLDKEMDDYITFFAEYPNVTNIVVRKLLDKPTKTYKPKGSAFVTFTTKEQCEAFLNLEKVEHSGVELVRKWQTVYQEEKKSERKDSKQPKDEFTIDLPKGAVLALEGLGESTTRESIKAVVEGLGGEVAFVDYSKGDPKGHVRLSVEGSGKTLFAKLEDGKFKVDDVEATAKLLEGDEEIAYLKQTVEQMKLRRKQASQRSRGFRGGQNRRNNRRGNDD